MSCSTHDPGDVQPAAASTIRTSFEMIREVWTAQPFDLYPNQHGHIPDVSGRSLYRPSTASMWV